jgi:riboflavin synthase
MFSGIVEAIGKINKIFPTGDCIDFTISADQQFDDLKIGDSIAINGVCLTITKLLANKCFNITAVPETLRVTNLGKLQENSPVNLERSIHAHSRLGGHYVQGHVDNIGEIIDIQKDGEEAILVKIKIPSILNKYIINKGYIGLDGMSITVIDATPEWFTVTFIPHTQQNTIVKNYQVGTLINIEVDMIAKYIEKLVGAR